jgi:hypothetical protein
LKNSCFQKKFGALFGSKISWGYHVSHAIAKADKALYAIKISKKILLSKTNKDPTYLIFYSILYYNSDILAVSIFMFLIKKQNHFCLLQGTSKLLK